MAKIKDLMQKLKEIEEAFEEPTIASAHPRKGRFVLTATIFKPNSDHRASVEVSFEELELAKGDVLELHKQNIIRSLKSKLNKSL